MPRSGERDRRRTRSRSRDRDYKDRRRRSRERDSQRHMSNSDRSRSERRRSRERDYRDDERRRHRSNDRDDDYDRRRRRHSRDRNDYDRRRNDKYDDKDFNKKRNKEVNDKKHLDEEQIPWGGIPKIENSDEPKEKEKPSLQPSGKLLEDTNVVKGTVVKYVEPPEAKLPRHNWQLHPFRNTDEKEPEALPVMHIHRRSCFLVGRDRKVCQFPMDHPSCSKQHAALQFRSLQYTRPDGENGRRTRPYLIDLESSNGTYINDERIEPSRYYELKHGDEIKFGYSSRSFVILNATAALNQLKDRDNDDDEVEEESEQEDIKPSTSTMKKEVDIDADEKFEI